MASGASLKSPLFNNPSPASSFASSAETIMDEEVITLDGNPNAKWTTPTAKRLNFKDSSSSINRSKTNTGGTITTTLKPKFLSQSLRSKLMALMADIHVDSKAAATLPQMVLIGDQSSGKSSLVSILTGIPLPVHQSMTTRNPLLCRTFCEEGITKPEFKISVHFFRQKLIGRVALPIPEEYQSVHLLHDWQPISPSMDKMIEEAIVCALAPNFDRNWNFTGPDDLIKTTGPGPKSISDLPESMISENVVILEVRSDSHEAEELVDFPGIQHKGAGQDPIRKLMREYVSKPNVSLLTCIEASASEQSLECLQLREDLDPTNSRTLNVITKTDRFQVREGGTPIWVQKALAEPTKWAFVCPFSQSPMKKGEDFKVRIQEEQDLWDDPKRLEGPWADLPRDSLGISNLLPRIAAFNDMKRRQAIVNQSLTLRTRIGELESALGSLPPSPTGNPLTLTMEAISQVADAIGARLQPSKSFQPTALAVKTFSQKLEATTLVLVPHSSTSQLFKDVIGRHQAQCKDIQVPSDQIMDVEEATRLQSESKHFGTLLNDDRAIIESLVNRGQKDWEGWSTHLQEDIWRGVESELRNVVAGVAKQYPILADQIQAIIDEEIAMASAISKEHAKQYLHSEVKFMLMEEGLLRGEKKRESEMRLSLNIDGTVTTSSQRAPAFSGSHQDSATSTDVGPATKKHKSSIPAQLLTTEGNGIQREDAVAIIAIYVDLYLRNAAYRVSQWAERRAKADRAGLLANLKHSIQTKIFQDDGDMTSFSKLRAILEPDEKVVKEKARIGKKLGESNALLFRCDDLVKEIEMA